MTRLTDNDRHFGPVTYARCSESWRPLRLVYSSGGDDDSDRPVANTLTAYACGWVARIRLPRLLDDFKIRHIASTWDQATVARMGRNWYDERFPREYGFSLSDGFLQVFLGAQTHDSETTQSWCTHLPWTNWRHIRTSFYDDKGRHFWAEWDRPRGFKLRDDWMARQAIEKACPNVVFEFDDFDGKRIRATTHIEEREWRFGTGWFKWLSLFRSPRIRRSLSIDFSGEVGPEKGSWKGGTTGTGIDMQPGETPESAFRRYCEQDHRSKYQTYRITFVGVAPTAQGA